MNVEGIVSDLSEIEEDCILVHGANAYRDEIAEELGVPKQTITSVSGYESVYSDEDAIDVIMMAYAGLRNKRIVECCRREGIDALGLSGLDGGVIQGRRNRGIKAEKEGKTVIVRDKSGKPEGVNEDLLRILLDRGYVPVLTIPIVDENGAAINAENDNVVVELQRTLRARCVVQLIEAPGLMEDIDDPDSKIENRTPSELEEMEDRKEGRIKRKLHSLNKLFENDVEEVVISDGRVDRPVNRALEGEGTNIVGEQ